MNLIRLTFLLALSGCAAKPPCAEWGERMGRQYIPIRGMQGSMVVKETMHPYCIRREGEEDEVLLLPKDSETEAAADSRM